VTDFFFPPAHDVQHSSSFTQKKILLKKQEISHGVTARENSPSCLSSETTKAKPQKHALWSPGVLCEGDRVLRVEKYTPYFTGTILMLSNP